MPRFAEREVLILTAITTALVTLLTFFSSGRDWATTLLTVPFVAVRSLASKSVVSSPVFTVTVNAPPTVAAAVELSSGAGDVVSKVTSALVALLARLREIPGVAEVESRLVFDVTIRTTGQEVPATARMISRA